MTSEGDNMEAIQASTKKKTPLPGSAAAGRDERKLRGQKYIRTEKKPLKAAASHTSSASFIGLPADLPKPMFFILIKLRVHFVHSNSK